MRRYARWYRWTRNSVLFSRQVFALIAVGVVTLAVVVVAGLLLLESGQEVAEDDAGPTSTPLPGTVLEPPRDLADFTLTGHTGEPVSLGDLRGQVVLLYFGYTHCPDVCPLTLATYRQVKTRLGEDADRLAVVFISVDGERDTPDRLASYVTAFDPDFIGLSGTDAEIRQVGQDYGLFFQRSTYDNTATDYVVDHTASTFVIGPQGRLRIIYPFGTGPDIIAAGVRSLLADG
jgi:protein SCO1/2